VTAVSQIVERGQTSAVAKAIVYLQQNYMGRKMESGKNELYGMRELMRVMDQMFDDYGLDVIANVDSNCMYANELSPELVRPRVQEISAALNRLRTLKIIDGYSEH